MSSSNDQVALITGSGRQRVGFVVARHLARCGFAVALHYHSSQDEARKSVDEIRSIGVTCEAYQANVASEAEVDRMFAQAIERFGRLDAVVTTASIWDAMPLEEITAEEVRRQFDINTLGTFLCARRAGLIMCGQSDGGAIITIGDWAIERPYPDHSAYFVAKGAIPTLTKSLAVELAGRNPQVRVNCIHPGPVMFPPNVDDEEKRTLIDATLTRNPNSPEEVAKAVEFFIENKFVTGACLPVDGGRTIYSRENR